MASTLAVNPSNVIINKVAEDQSARDLTYLLFEAALLTSGFARDEWSFAQRLSPYDLTWS